jgi:hypothetical protein
MNEATLQAILEAFLANDHTRCLPELLLGDTHSGHNFVNLFIVGRSKTPSAASSIPVIELKNVSLSALWEAQNELRDRSGEPESSDVEDLRKQLLAETEDTLLERRYRYWDLSARCWKTDTLLTLKEGALSQLAEYMRHIQQGPSEGPPGILDNRVCCKEGADDLRGYVVMCIGGTRVLAWGGGMMQTKWTYTTSDSMTVL